MKAENKFGFPVEGTLEDWIATQECPERFRIVGLKKTVNGVEEEGLRAAELYGVIVAEERRLPSCTPIVLPYRVKRLTLTKEARVSGLRAGKQFSGSSPRALRPMRVRTSISRARSGRSRNSQNHQTSDQHRRHYQSQSPGE